MEPFERRIRDLTSEINGQYPRPWMTDLEDPKSAKVFVVGYNPKTPYMANAVNYERFIDALFNRNGEGCRRFYNEVTKQTPTRGNIEWFSEKLARAGIDAIIETNVICYGGKKNDLDLPEHEGGRDRGTDIFRFLVSEIQPEAIIVHGKGVCDEFSRAFGLKLPDPPKTSDQFVKKKLGIGSHVFVIPPLGEPGFRNWPRKPLRSFCNWANSYLDEVAYRVAQTCTA